MTMIYTHVLNRDPSGVRNPMDGLGYNTKRWRKADPQ